jgi:hypothetical protein
MANVRAVGEDYEKGILNYEMEVLFLRRDSYTAEVRLVLFSLDKGNTTAVSVSTPALQKVEVIHKPLIISCKLKQGLIIKPLGVIELLKTPALPELPTLKVELAKLKVAELSPIFWFYAKGLATTPCDTIPTAVSGTQDVYNTFGSVFGTGQASMRVGNACTTSTVSGFLKFDSKLLAWNHIGHGWPGGVVLWDTSLTAAVIQVFNPNRGINCAVALVNSCNTFNDPLKAAFLSNNPRTFIAGAISLPIGRSENVDKCFWRDVLINKKPMAIALNNCSRAQGLAGAFGLAGDGGLFW